MSKLKIATNINIDLEFETSAFHKRLLAWFIDFMIALIYFFLIYQLLTSMPENIFGEEGAQWITILIGLPVIFYPLITESLMQGQTVGKKILHIRVINATGGNATISQYIIRWMLRVADFLLVIYFWVFISTGTRGGLFAAFVVILALVDVFCIASTKTAQRIGDLAANTIVIDIKTKSSLDDTIFRETEEKYVPLYPEVMRLSDRDINMIKNILDSLHKNYNYDLAERTTWKICNALNIGTKQMPVDFLETLLKDYNHISTR